MVQSTNEYLEQYGMNQSLVKGLINCIMDRSMKYQGFSSDENMVSSEDIIFIFHTVKISQLSSVLQSQPIGNEHRE